MIEYSAYDIAILPLIIGVVALIVKLGLPKKLAPVIALILGIAAGIVYVAPTDLPQAVLVGITLGLAASGLYSGAKSGIESYRNTE